MQIMVNGQERTLEAPVTVAALLHQLGVQGQRVAVEVNLEIVPRSRHAEVELHDHDQVEVVYAIGGG